MSRQLRERHTKLEDFASWLGLVRRVQGGDVRRLQQEETALALWHMYLTYGGKPLEQHQDKFDEMKEESAAFTKVCSTSLPLLLLSVADPCFSGTRKVCLYER